MKVCYISNTYFTDTDLEIIKGLQATCEICYAVILPFKNNNFTIAQLNESVKQGNSVAHIKATTIKGRQRDPRNLPAYYKWLKSLELNKYDVIYISNTEDLFLSMMLLAYTFKKTVVHGVHDAVHHSGWTSNFFMRAANNLLLNRSNALLCFSGLQQQALESRFPHKQTFKIPLALKDFGVSAINDKAYGTISFLFFGNIAFYKGLDVLLKAVKKLSARYKNFLLVIAGRCNDWATQYQQYVDDTMPVKKYIRFIDNNEIAPFFNEAHYLILPYRDVTQSGPLMIAYNYSLPVLASHLEGFAEFIEEGKTGFFFKPADVGSLCDVMEAAINRKEHDYQQLRTQVKQYAERFDVRMIASQYQRMFQQVRGAG